MVLYDRKIDLGVVVFSRDFSRENSIWWVNKLLLGPIDRREIIMTISKAMIMYIGITSKISRPK